MQLYVPFVVAAVVMAGQAFAQPAKPVDAPTGWIVDARTGCKVWDSAPDPDEKIAWSGRCENGMAEGPGTLQFFVGGEPAARYEGELRNGRADGHGVSLEPDGTRYEGNWRDNAASGFGVYTKGSTRVEGQWSNGCLKQGATELAVGVSRESCGFNAEVAAKP